MEVIDFPIGPRGTVINDLLIECSWVTMDVITPNNKIAFKDESGAVGKKEINVLRAK